jgi:phosphoserine phosphatase
MTASGGFDLTIATLIAAGRLDERMLGAARDRLAEHGLSSRVERWIDAGDALDLEVAGQPSAIRAALEGWEGVDIIAQPTGPRPRRLFVADMDSTMIGQECIDELADFAGLKTEVAAITERAMLGELDFAAALAERVALLAGLEATAITRCLDERIRPNPGAATLIATLASRGIETLLVTGGFTDFAEPVGRGLGFSRIAANRLEQRDGRLTGRTLGPLVDSAAKRRLLVQTRLSLGVAADATMAIGDGANDSAMIEAAGIGLGYRPKPALARVADAVIAHHALDALLWVEGIPRSEWTLRG